MIPESFSPIPVLRTGHANRALLGHSCEAPKAICESCRGTPGDILRPPLTSAAGIRFAAAFDNQPHCKLPAAVGTSRAKSPLTIAATPFSYMARYRILEKSEEFRN
jgi:hypothetical protein